MKIIIRADASVEIGSGHVMRCLTIAKKLQVAGCDVRFWMEPLTGNLIEYVRMQGFQTILEAQTADLYIIDHYRLDLEWERFIRYYARKIMVIDDLARVHDCDLLLDQNVVPFYEKRYEGKVPVHCVQLVGPKYLLMRDEFIIARHQIKQRQKKVENLLVFMGGSDPTNETMKVLAALRLFNFMNIDIVVGDSNRMKKEIEEICLEEGYQFHCQIDYMAELMLKADFAIGAGGATLWERCYVGLPSSSTIVADNQKETTAYAGLLGVTKNLGWHEQVTVETYRQLLISLTVEEMSEKGLQLTSGEQPNAWMHEILELIK